jgi:hypothetical protein
MSPFSSSPPITAIFRVIRNRKKKKKSCWSCLSHTWGTPELLGLHALLCKFYHHTVNNTCEDFAYTKRRTKDVYDSPCPLRHHRRCERNLITIICDVSMATVSWVGVFLLQNASKTAQLPFNPTLRFLKIKLEMTWRTNISIIVVHHRYPSQNSHHRCLSLCPLHVAVGFQVNIWQFTTYKCGIPLRHLSHRRDRGTLWVLRALLRGFSQWFSCIRWTCQRQRHPSCYRWISQMPTRTRT